MMDSLRLRLATPTIGPPPATPNAPPPVSELALLLAVEPVEKPPPAMVLPGVVGGVRNPAGSGMFFGSVPTGKPCAFSGGVAALVAGVPSGFVAPLVAELASPVAVVGQPAVEEL